MSYGELAKIAEEDFFDVVVYSQIIAGKLRLHIVDGSYLDIWVSVKIEERFAYYTPLGATPHPLHSKAKGVIRDALSVMRDV